MLYMMAHGGPLETATERRKQVMCDHEKTQSMTDKFAERIESNINDSFYAEGTSWEGKIKNLRTYAEILIRFILTKPDGSLTLGDKKTSAVANGSSVTAKAWKTIRTHGDASTRHTT